MLRFGSEGGRDIDIGGFVWDSIQDPLPTSFSFCLKSHLYDPDHRIFLKIIFVYYIFKNN